MRSFFRLLQFSRIRLSFIVFKYRKKIFEQIIQPLNDKIRRITILSIIPFFLFLVKNPIDTFSKEFTTIQTIDFWNKNIQQFIPGRMSRKGNFLQEKSIDKFHSYLVWKPRLVLNESNPLHNQCPAHLGGR